MRSLFLITVVSVSLMSGCASIYGLRNTNQKNIKRLSVGMSRQEAVAIMGDKNQTMYVRNALGIYKEGIGFDDFKKISNPYRRETFSGQDKILEVDYYVTDVKKDDGKIKDDELTPLVFENERLIGWGWDFLKAAVKDRGLLKKGR